MSIRDNILNYILGVGPKEAPESFCHQCGSQQRAHEKPLYCRTTGKLLKMEYGYSICSCSEI